MQQQEAKSCFQCAPSQFLNLFSVCKNFYLKMKISNCVETASSLLGRRSHSQHSDVENFKKEYKDVKESLEVLHV